MRENYLIFLSLLAFSFSTYSQDIAYSQKNFSVELGSSRIIFNGNKKTTSVSVLNKQPYPFLAQSSSVKEDSKTQGSYIITPPVIRLEPNQKSNLVIRLIKSEFPDDRESMERICVKGIPPKDNLEKENISKPEVVVQLSMNTCIKIFYRPYGIKEYPEQYYSTVKWSLSDGYYIAKNTSPFYINFNTVKQNGKTIAGFDYVPPFGQKRVKAFSKGGDIEWNVITDIGGITPVYKSYLVHE